MRNSRAVDLCRYRFSQRAVRKYLQGGAVATVSGQKQVLPGDMCGVPCFIDSKNTKIA